MEWDGEYRRYRNLYRRAYSDSRRGKRLLFVAQSERDIIGQIFVQLQTELHSPSSTGPVGYLYALRVRPPHRGQGIGTRLIQEAESRLVERGYQRALIAVAIENHAARRLYERLGYHVVGEDPGEWTYLDDEGNLREVHEPAFLLEKQLASARAQPPGSPAS
jgi:ribosomal protein S18 acetylase RimI-like enzyme